MIKKTCKINKLDKIISKYVRLRDTDDHGYGQCVTCGKTVFWKEAHAGHFISRSKPATRYNVKNINLQCPHCNTFCEGNQYLHGKEIDQKYGNGTAEELEQLSRVRGFKTDKMWIELEYKKFFAMVKEISKHKMMEV